MASVNQKSVSSQPATQPATINAVALAALSKMSGNEPWRDGLAAGSQHTVELTVSGTVDGKQIETCEVAATVTVGHDSTRASSSTPNQSILIGYILGKLNEVTRNAILRDMPADYAAHGCELPEVPREIAAATDAMLKKLRAEKQTDVRGSVSVKYAIEAAKPATARKTGRKQA